MVVRVAQPDKPAFQLRPREAGISVFLLDAVDPPLTESEILQSFRTGSIAVVRSEAEILGKGLTIIPIPGAAFLPPRLQEAHGEIAPGPDMDRDEFKAALKELE